MTRQDIIGAAFRVWGREFYRSTSLSGLAAELGVSKTALYRHYKNKQELLEDMYGAFLDAYADFIREDFERAAAMPGFVERCSVIARMLIEFYGQHRDYFIFAIVKVYGEWEIANTRKGLLLRGIDIARLAPSGMEAFSGDWSLAFQMSTATLVLWTAHFYKHGCGSAEVPGEEAVRELVDSVEKIIIQGLGFDRARVEGLGFDALETLAVRRLPPEEPGQEILWAVGEAVAEAGPWGVSMEMVARRLGLSKSSLYAHFKNKGDMIKQFFMTEFGRILKCGEGGMGLSKLVEEQLYLGIFSIVSYLRSRPNILVAMDWLRTRRPDIRPEDQLRFSRLFQGIMVQVEGRPVDFSSPEVERISQWILFLIVHTLMRRPGNLSFKDIPNSRVRTLYRFITLGVGGIIKELSYE
jgi:AcrR family transcriptional regulator